MPRERFTLVVQAGGQSRRVGEDKALMPFLGRPLIQRIQARLSALAGEVVVVTNRPDEYRFLGVRLVPDVVAGWGALGGLYTGLLAAETPLVGVVACDMPFVNPDLMEAEGEALHRAGADVAIPQTATGMEPFHAVYRRDACLPAIARAIQDGERRMVSWLSQVRVHAVTAEEIERHDPHGLAFMNLNTREDFERAEEIARALLGEREP